jgi:DNA (cytosine-5)-methyltransferase 1
MAALSVRSASVIRRARRTVSSPSKSINVSLAVQAKANEQARSPVVHSTVSASKTFPGGFVPWAGAKGWAHEILKSHLPGQVNRLIFACAGAAADAIGYAGIADELILGDANADLIAAHRWVQKDVERALRVLGRLFTKANNTKTAYNHLREEFRAGKVGSARRAALFIYLMWHTTNGLCRYNKQGKFNASFGYRNSKTGAAVAVPENALRRFVAALGTATFKVSDMLDTIAMAGPDDVVIIDPPYRPAAGKTSTHTSYTTGGFTLTQYQAMVKAAGEAAARGATVFIHDHDTEETRQLHSQCSELLPVNVERKIGKQRVIVAEAVFIYRSVKQPMAVAPQKIEEAPVAAANDVSFSGWNEFGVIDAPKLAVTFAGRTSKADATLWAHPVEGQWFAGFDFAFRTGEYLSETRLPAKLDAGCETASLAVKQAAEQLLADLASRFPDLKSLVKAEASQVSAMREWLHVQIDIAHSGGFEEKPAFTFIDLFAGIGGFHLAMKQAGGKCVLACEKDDEARKTYLANHNMGGVPFAADITQLAVADVPDHDVLCAGFPCQAYSIAGGKRGFEDARGGLIFEMLRIVRGKLPKVLLLENVMNFCSGEGGAWHRTLRRQLAGMGYAISSKVLNAAHFGTAQERERVFFVAYRRDAFANVQDFHVPVGDGKWVSVADILEPNALAGHHDIKDMTPAPTLDPASPFKRVGKMNGRRGQDARVYDPAGHAATLMANQQNCGLYLVNGKPRALTPRERARLQGFPDTFQPHSVKTHANRQFGNSVAVPVVAAIGHAVANQFFNQAA